MKNTRRISFICLLGLLCSLTVYGQYWIDFRWNDSYCRKCRWMEQALHLSGSRAAEYHKVVHRYGQRIEREARRDNRYWDKSARKIYNLRMERDRRIQYLLSPSQFRMYIRFVREDPRRIHDYRDWYSNNPRYPGHRPSHDCRRYEDNYWNYRWNSTNERRWESDDDDDDDDDDDRWNSDDDRRQRSSTNSRRGRRSDD